MKKFKLTHLIGMVLLFWSASPAVQRYSLITNTAISVLLTKMHTERLSSTKRLLIPSLSQKLLHQHPGKKSRHFQELASATYSSMQA